MVELRVRPKKCVSAPNPQYAYPEMRVKYGLKRRTAPHGYTFIVPVGHIYELRWDLMPNERADIESFSIDYGDVTSSDKIWFRSVYQQPPDHFVINGIDTKYLIPGTNDSAVPGFDMSVDPEFDGTFGTWGFDDASRLVMAPPSTLNIASALHASISGWTRWFLRESLPARRMPSSTRPMGG